jgi:hypothetical protein
LSESGAYIFVVVCSACPAFSDISVTVAAVPVVPLVRVKIVWPSIEEPSMKVWL